MLQLLSRVSCYKVGVLRSEGCTKTSSKEYQRNGDGVSRVVTTLAEITKRVWDTQRERVTHVLSSD